MNTENLIPSDQELLRIKALNTARQKRFYAINKEKIKETKRLKYKAQVDALKALNGVPLEDPYQYEHAVAHAEPDLEEVVAPVKKGKAKEADTAAPVEIATAFPTKPPPVPVQAFNTNESYKTYSDIVSKLYEKDQTHYESHLRTVFKILQTKNYLTTLNGAKKVLKLINEARHSKKNILYAINAKKAYLQAILRTITQLSLPVPEAQFKIYKLAFDTSKLDSIDYHEEVMLNHTVMPFKDYLNKVKSFFGGLSKQFVMSSLYYDVTLRDDFHLKVVKTLADTKDTEEQYLIVPIDKEERLTIIINKYKTVARYGVIKVLLAKKMSDLIRDYMDAESIKYGKYLFGTSPKNTGFVSKFNREIGIEASITEFRTMKSSEFKLSNEERTKLADDMKHSPYTNLKYIRALKR